MPCGPAAREYAQISHVAFGEFTFEVVQEFKYLGLMFD